MVERAIEIVEHDRSFSRSVLSLDSQHHPMYPKWSHSWGNVKAKNEIHLPNLVANFKPLILFFVKKKCGIKTQSASVV